MGSEREGAAAGDSRVAPSLLYAVKQVELAVRAGLEELLRPVGVTALQYTALTVLARRDGLTGAELARNSFVRPQTMGELVGALERRGLVRRVPDPTHGRRLLIGLTAAGRQLLADVEDAVRALEDRMAAGLDDVERAALGEYLNRCRIALESVSTR